MNGRKASHTRPMYTTIECRSICLILFVCCAHRWQENPEKMIKYRKSHWCSSRMHIALFFSERVCTVDQWQWQRQQLATVSMAANTKRNITYFGTSSIFIQKRMKSRKKTTQLNGTEQIVLSFFFRLFEQTRMCCRLVCLAVCVCVCYVPQRQK